jgi:hypothetical protein
MIAAAKNNFLKSLLICFSIALVFTLLAAFSSAVHVGFFGHLASLISLTLFPTIGVFVGDTFRRFVVPDAYFTTGAIDTFKKKVFWMIGPQCIGWFIGLMASNGFMKNVLGYQGLFA